MPEHFWILLPSALLQVAVIWLSIHWRFNNLSINPKIVWCVSHMIIVRHRSWHYSSYYMAQQCHGSCNYIVMLHTRMYIKIRTCLYDLRYHGHPELFWARQNYRYYSNWTSVYMKSFKLVSASRVTLAVGSLCLWKRGTLEEGTKLVYVNSLLWPPGTTRHVQ